MTSFCAGALTMANLKKRLFGLTNREGNHGEVVKETTFTSIVCAFLPETSTSILRAMRYAQ